MKVQNQLMCQNLGEEKKTKQVNITGSRGETGVGEKTGLSETEEAERCRARERERALCFP